MHSFTVDRDTFLDEDEVTVVVQLTCSEVTGSEATLALCFTSLSLR